MEEKKKKVIRQNIDMLSMVNDKGDRLIVSGRMGHPRFSIFAADYEKGSKDYTKMATARMKTGAMKLIAFKIKGLATGVTEDEFEIELNNYISYKDGDPSALGIDSVVRVSLEEKWISLTIEEWKDAKLFRVYTFPIILDPKWFTVKTKGDVTTRILRANLDYAVVYADMLTEAASIVATAQIVHKKMEN